MQINSIQDLVEYKNQLIETQDVIAISSILDLTYTIKLRGGKYDDYNANYITGDIAKIVLEYQIQYEAFIEELEKEFNIQLPQSKRVIKFKIEKGCVKIDAEFWKEIITEGIRHMDGWQNMVVFSIAIIGFFTYKAYGQYIEKERKALEDARKEREDARKNETMNNLIEIMKEVALSPLQIPANKLKRTIAGTLEDNEEAFINPTLEDAMPITNNDIGKFRSKYPAEQEEDIEETIIIEDTIEAEFFRKKGKPLILTSIGKEAITSTLSVAKRVKLLRHAQNGKAVILKIKVIKDSVSGKVKEAYILDLIEN